MQVARTLMPIPPAGPSSQDPRRGPDAEENGGEIDRNNHQGHAAETKRISSDGTPQRKPRPCRSAGRRFAGVKIVRGRESCGKTSFIARNRKPKNAEGMP